MHDLWTLSKLLCWQIRLSLTNSVTLRESWIRSIKSINFEKMMISTQEIIDAPWKYPNCLDLDFAL